MKNKNNINNSLTFSGNLVNGIYCDNGYMTIGNDPFKDKFEVREVIFNFPVTIVVWKNGEKTIVKCGDNDTRDDEKSFTWAVAKRALGTNAQIKKLIENANRPQEKIVKKKKQLPKPNQSVSDEETPF